MGILSNSLRTLWSDFMESVQAADDLQKALDANDLQAASTALAHAKPSVRPHEDRVIQAVGKYSLSAAADPEIVTALRAQIYEQYDSNMALPERYLEPWQRKEIDALKTATGYKNPLEIYAVAAYMNDVEKLKELGAQGVTPDAVSDSAHMTESLVVGVARRDMFDSLKEIVRQGASLDRAYGLDDFPPLHYFSLPLFHEMHPGVTSALIGTGKREILDAVKKATAPQEAASRPEAPALFAMS